jgi:protoporphyrin/coproporphyrin ferrochelatase
MARPASVSVLLLAHGTISSEQEIPAFLQEIRQGRPAPPALIEEMRHRYRAIGGSPLLEHTRAQAAALEQRLGLPVRVAMRFSAPRLEAVLGQLGPDEVVHLLPLAPLSVPIYEAAARSALATLPHPPTLVSVLPWALERPLILEWAQRIREAYASAVPPCRLIVTAHSLPKIVIERGDRYEVQAVQAAAGVSGVIAYQSQGQSAGAWLGPTLLEELEAARTAGQKSVLVAPLGFVSEHVETLFDLDIEAKAQAEALGLEFLRLPTPGDSAGLISAMECALRRSLGELEPLPPAG